MFREPEGFFYDFFLQLRRRRWLGVNDVSAADYHVADVAGVPDGGCRAAQGAFRLRPRP